MAAVILTGRSVLADWYVVPTGSMKPTILEGDRVFVWKSAYQFRVPFSRVRLFETGTPKRGDVVVIRNPDGGSVPVRQTPRRAPGRRRRAAQRDALRQQEGATHRIPPRAEVRRRRDDPPRHRAPRRAATPACASCPTGPRSARSVPITVPEGEVFLMGDNRDESRDARFFGTRPDPGPPRPRRGRHVELESAVLQGPAMVAHRPSVHHGRPRGDAELSAVPEPAPSARGDGRGERGEHRPSDREHGLLVRARGTRTSRPSLTRAPATEKPSRVAAARSAVAVDRAASAEPGQRHDDRHEAVLALVSALSQDDVEASSPPRDRTRARRRGVAGQARAAAARAAAASGASTPPVNASAEAASCGQFPARAQSL